MTADPVHTMPEGHTSHPCEALKTEKGCYWCCSACDYNKHQCGGCGTYLTHLGHETSTKFEFENSQIVVTIVTYTEHEKCYEK